MTTRILLVDDHELLRSGLRLTIEREPGLVVVGEASSGAEALAQVQQLKPNLVVMDVGLGDGCGIDFSREILTRFPDVRVLVLSAIVNESLVDAAVKAGVKGYVLKTSAMSELVLAIGAVAAGRSYLCRDASEALVNNYKRLAVADAPIPPTTVTDREREVWKLTADGLRMKDIANRLSISVKTVETHRASLMKKLACGSSAELTKRAIREGVATI